MAKTVTFIAQNHYFNCCLPTKVEGWDVRKIDFQFGEEKPSIRNLESDVFVLFRPDFFATDVLKSLRGKKVWISTEPFERQDVMPYIKSLTERFKEWDAIFHYDKTHIPTFQISFNLFVEEFILPVNLDIMTDDGLKKDFDVFFAGRSTVHRELFLGRLKRDFKLFHAAHGLIDEDFAYSAGRSKISLNINISGFAQLQHRLQNLLACGAFVLSEKQTHNDGIKSGQHYIIFGSEDDLVRKVKYYLANDTEREMIAAQGKNYVRQHLNADVQWEKLLRSLK